MCFQFWVSTFGSHNIAKTNKMCILKRLKALSYDTEALACTEIEQLGLYLSLKILFSCSLKGFHFLLSGGGGKVLQ